MADGLLSTTDVAAGPISWESAIVLYSGHMRGQQYRHATIKARRCHLRTLAAATPGGPTTVTTEQLVAWADSRGASGRQCWVIARVFFAWACRCAIVSASPVPPKTPSSRARQVARAEAFPQAWRAPLNAHTNRLLAAGRSGPTIRLHQLYLQQFALEYPDPWLVTGEDLTRWLARHQHWRPETRKSARGVLRQFYMHVRRPDGLTIVPTDVLASVRIPRALPRPTDQAAYEEALTVADDKVRLMILLAAYAGLRCREIAAVRPSTDAQDGFLYVTGKGGDQRRIPIHPLLAVELDEERARRKTGSPGRGYRWLGQLTVDGYLFPSQDGGHVTPGIVSKLLSAALPGRATGHTLRHRFASNAYASTRDLRAVQELLGHASPTTTARYVLTPDSALQAAVLGIAG